MSGQTAVPLFSVHRSERTSFECSLTKARTTWTFGLLVTGAFGVTTLLTGLALSALTASGAVLGVAAGRISIVLLAAAFPLLLMSAHCMDKIPECEKRLRAESMKRSQPPRQPPAV